MFTSYAKHFLKIKMLNPKKKALSSVPKLVIVERFDCNHKALSFMMKIMRNWKTTAVDKNLWIAPHLLMSLDRHARNVTVLVKSLQSCLFITDSKKEMS